MMLTCDFTVNRIFAGYSPAKKCLPKFKLQSLDEPVVIIVSDQNRGEDIMRYLAALIMLCAGVGLSAQVGLQMTTPEGGVNMSVTGVPANPQSNQEVVDQIVDRLEKLEKEVHPKLNRLDRKKAEKIMAEIYELLAEIQTVPAPQTGGAAASSSSSSSSSSAASSSNSATVNINISGMDNPGSSGSNPHHPGNNDPQQHNNPPHHQQQTSPKPMAENEFGNMIKQIKKESFSDNKMRVLRTAAKNYHFSCAQIVNVIDCFTFADDKLGALSITYPKVTDPKNNYVILDCFTYSADKAEAEDIMDR